MPDLGSIASVVGALVGVALGAWLSSRSQLRLHREAQGQAVLAAKEAAYVDFLATMRRFRRFVLTTNVGVSAVDKAASPRGPIPFIEGAEIHWDAAERAISRLWIVADVDGPVGRAAGQVMDAFYVVARARAANGRGAVAASVLEISQSAEREFARTAHRDLGRRVAEDERSE